MAAIDERVLALLEALRQGGAVSLAAVALERIEGLESGDDADADDDPEGGSAGDDRSVRREPEVALRQLDVADQVVMGGLQLEAALIEALPAELAALRREQAGRDEGAGFLVEEVTIAPDPIGEAGTDEGLRRGVRETPLFGEEQARVVAGLQKAWITANRIVREAISDRR